MPIGRIKAYNNKGVCFVFYTPFLFSDDGEGHFIDINNNVYYEPKMLFLPEVYEGNFSLFFLFPEISFYKKIP